MPTFHESEFGTSMFGSKMVIVPVPVVGIGYSRVSCMQAGLTEPAGQVAGGPRLPLRISSGAVPRLPLLVFRVAPVVRPGLSSRTPVKSDIPGRLKARAHPAWNDVSP